MPGKRTEFVSGVQKILSSYEPRMQRRKSWQMKTKRKPKRKQENEGENCKADVKTENENERKSFRVISKKDQINHDHR